MCQKIKGILVSQFMTPLNPGFSKLLHLHKCNHPLQILHLAMFSCFFPAVFSISESCNQYSSCVSRIHPRNCLTSVFSGASTENRTWEMSQCCSAIYALSFNVLSTTQIPGAFLCHQPEQPQRGPRKWQIPQTVSQVLISSTSLHPLPYFLSGSHQETFS